jgi:hypothetical protein
MAKTTINITPTDAVIILNENKPVHKGYNFTSDNVPYFRVGFSNADNPFAAKTEVFMVKGATFVNDARVEYPENRDAAIALSLKLKAGFMSPSVALNACNNASKPLFTKITEDTASYTIGDRTVTGYSRVFTLGTPVSALDAEMKRQSISWDATASVIATSAPSSVSTAADSTMPFDTE